VLGLVSLLGETTGGGFVWRVAFVLGGLAGFVEAVRYLHGPGSPGTVRRLAVVDPALYLLVVAAAFLPPGSFLSALRTWQPPGSPAPPATPAPPR
jgi:hypothetical protein